MPLAIVILAAGAGRRFQGDTESATPKQLAKIAGKSLLVRAIELAESIASAEIYVVLGYQSQAIQARLQDEKSSKSPIYCVNPNWDTGLAGSIACGIDQLPSDTEAVLILLADQVAIQPADLTALIDTYRKAESMPLVCAAYAESIGVPAIFPRRYFDELKSLAGDQGAKKVLLRHTHIAVPMPRAAVDIDTPEDLENYHV